MTPRAPDTPTPPQPAESAPSSGPKYQADAIGLKAVLGVAVALVLGGIVVNVALYFLLFRFVREDQERDPPPSPYAGELRRPADAPPLMGPAPEQFYAEQHTHLRDYGWIDRQAGRVRIPIDRAMELVVQRAREKSDKQPQQKEQPQ